MPSLETTRVLLQELQVVFDSLPDQKGQRKTMSQLEDLPRIRAELERPLIDRRLGCESEFS